MKSLTQMLTDLRLDLKDSGALWSNAELTRSIEKAVSDYSRFHPKEESYEITVDYTVTDETATTPAAASATAIVNAVSIATTVAGDTLTITLKTLNVPRPVALAITDANTSITDFAIIVKGTDRDDKAIEEHFYFPRGLSQTGKKYFKTVQEVEVDAITGNGANDALSLGYATHVGVWVQLANKPVKPLSETLTSSPAGTTYTRDTDYLMDYANGWIAVKSGGSLAAATAYLIDYTKSQIEIDLDSLQGFMGVKEIVFADDAVPQRMVHYSIWSKKLTLLGTGVEGQEALSDDDHIAVRYYAVQNPPKTWAPGSYPEFIENAVLLAASAFALFTKALA